MTTPPVGERLLWISGWGIWPSSENWALYDRLRAGFGEPRPINEAPALVTNSSEIDEMAAFVQIALIFGWDAHLLSAQGRTRSFISHDEWISLGADDEGLVAAATSELRTAGVPLLPAGPG